MFKEKIKKINLIGLLLSITLVLGVPFIFDMKTVTSGVEYRGFPFDWLALFPNNGFSFKGVGFLLNVILFYLLITFFMNKFKEKRKKNNTKQSLKNY